MTGTDSVSFTTPRRINPFPELNPEPVERSGSKPAGGNPSAGTADPLGSLLGAKIPTDIPVTTDAPKDKPAAAQRVIRTTPMMRNFNWDVVRYFSQLAEKSGEPVDPSVLNTPEHLAGLKALMEERAGLAEIPGLEKQLAEVNVKIKELEAQRTEALKNIAKHGSDKPGGKEPPMDQKQLEQYAIFKQPVDGAKKLIPILEKELQDLLASGTQEDSPQVIELKNTLAEFKDELTVGEAQLKELLDKMPLPQQQAFILRGEKYLDKREEFDGAIGSQMAQRDEITEALNPLKDRRDFLNNVFDFKNNPNRRFVFLRIGPDDPYAVNIFEFAPSDPRVPVKLPADTVIKLDTGGKPEERVLRKVVPGSSVSILKEITVR